MKRSLAFILILATLLSLCTVFASAKVADVSKDNPLYKKSVLFCGDSICEASNDATGRALYGGFGWASRIMSWNKMGGINKGKSAASISNCRGENTIIAQLKSQAGNKFDFVILHGGVNDAWDNAAVGVMTEGFDGPFNNTTYAGGLEEAIKYAKDNFKDAKLGYILNFSLPSAKWGRISDMTEYFDMAKQICDKWEVPYLDLYSNDELNINILKTHTTYYVPDTVHPNSAGYDIITPYINDWMKEIAVEVEEEASEPEGSAVVEESVSDAVSAATEGEKDGSVPPYVVAVIVIVVAAAAGAVIIIVAKKKKA